jgi:Big-like domain-containing protein/calcineurin-like phosphoesterase family protein
MRPPALTMVLLSALTLSCSHDVESPPAEGFSEGAAQFSAKAGGTGRSITVTPASATIAVGLTVQLTARTKPAKSATYTWSSSNTAVAQVSATGLVTGIAAGSATITVRSGTKSGTASITVTSAPAPVASVSVAPSSASVQVGATVQLTATLRDAQGNVLTGRTVTWSSDATSVATVSPSGLVTGKAAGSATITATSESKSGGSAITATAAPPPSGSAVLVGAGDIASCSSSGDEATATLLDGISGTVFTAGDNAYSSGTTTEFANCYDPTWGRHKARTKPAPGNHDYNTSGATGYYAYYGSAAGPSGRGYYSYDLGNWHIVSLNSEVSMSAGSAQEQWLRADLAASSKQCTLAYWHKPRFSSGTTHGSLSAAQPLWQALYDYGAEIAIAGHEHNYERFAPQTPTGAADPTKGIREFVVGTGGVSHYTGFSKIPNTEVFNGSTWGVFKLTLGAGTYSWQFVPVAGASFTDSGSGQCH